MLPPLARATAPVRRPSALADAACVLALLAFALALTAPILGGGVPIATDTLRLWGPPAPTPPAVAVHNVDLADSALLYLPWQVFIRRSLAGGEWPLWNPDVFAGYPFQGNPQTQLYYPLTWIGWLLPLAFALQASAIFHIWLAGAGMYGLARLLGARRAGSLLAGLAFAGSSPLLFVIDFPGQADIYGWLPWVLAAGEVAWRRRSWRWTAAAGLLFGVLALAGHLQWFLYSALFLAAWFGARLGAAAWDAWRRPAAGVGRRLGGQALRAGALLAWGPALAAVQLVPFLELPAYSTRTTPAGVAPAVLDLGRSVRLLGRQLTVFVPQIAGTSVGSIGAPLNNINCWYVGLAPLALALVALLLVRRRAVLFLGAVGVAAFGAAAGLPVLDRFQHLPGLQALLPQRIAYLFIFCAALLSGLGFDALVGLARRRPGAAAGVVALLALLALPVAGLLAERHAAAAGQPALYDLQSAALRQATLVAGVLLVWGGLLVASGGLRRAGVVPVLAVGLLGLTAWDLLTYAPGYNTYVPASTLTLDSPAAAAMRGDAAPGRMLALSSAGPLFVPQEAVLYGLQDVAGYDSLHLARYEDFWAAVDPAVRGGGYFDVMMQPQDYTHAQAALLNVAYVVANQPLAAASRPPTLAPVYIGAGAVYRNTAALPRVFTVAAAQVLSATAIPARLAAPGFDPRQAVLLETAPPPNFGTAPADRTPPGAATITAYRNLSVDVRAQMDRPGWLVLGDVNYPGWGVTVDGQPAPLYTAYGLVRAVPLPAGTHTVRFTFRPLSFEIGAGVSLVALLVALAVLLRCRGRVTSDE